MNVPEVSSRTQEVANRLVELCREGRNVEAIDELYHDNVVSCEMDNWPGGPKQIEGIKQVVEKNEQWMDSVAEMHSGKISDPVVAGNHFTIKMDYDVTFKEQGRRKMEELGVYQVDQSGKIVKEQFFYDV
ncbi:MAG: nuclear transport factor 2 family protein [Flavobacteriaceae bacterium]|nr:nuclear transport factor 2 family protein [Bacteroidia bacterium]MBT8287905.1 nuclear transport factor 2 family protein [Bacteroidia bacterium]NNF74523.1 nuclear transport factor 2 family protein [Flavobacteriaceae bacterium]NNK72126.1 nuclear transport factor 2 family protein [Flavobacteriaceae bacterium]